MLRHFRDAPAKRLLCDFETRGKLNLGKPAENRHPASVGDCRGGERGVVVGEDLREHTRQRGGYEEKALLRDTLRDDGLQRWRQLFLGVLKLNAAVRIHDHCA